MHQGTKTHTHKNSKKRTQGSQQLPGQALLHRMCEHSPLPKLESSAQWCGLK